MSSFRKPWRLPGADTSIICWLYRPLRGQARSHRDLGVRTHRGTTQNLWERACPRWRTAHSTVMSAGLAAFVGAPPGQSPLLQWIWVSYAPILRTDIETCGSGLAREGGLTFNSDVGCTGNAFAGKPAPTVDLGVVAPILRTTSKPVGAGLPAKADGTFNSDVGWTDRFCRIAARASPLLQWIWGVAHPICAVRHETCGSGLAREGGCTFNNDEADRPLCRNAARQARSHSGSGCTHNGVNDIETCGSGLAREDGCTFNNRCRLTDRFRRNAARQARSYSGSGCSTHQL